MTDFIKVPQRRLAQWERRAITLQTKAENLLAAMTDEIGCDNSETDYPDAVVERCEELTDFLARWRKAMARGGSPA